ncbi:hypothetical protein MBAV_001619 [Candidatus Magnetobacterium bavaricum]|uniref:Uncharacterized protein n=1 Tax=Candidatus Magnetobacterium bavaricum TaxID=29290 RepID=A0A0F3GWE8_9BACT|nr:hypothetical protein MBAV_001619 [Candidatus Magnetobacterium bavaricum]
MPQDIALAIGVKILCRPYLPVIRHTRYCQVIRLLCGTIHLPYSHGTGVDILP